MSISSLFESNFYYQKITQTLRQQASSPDSLIEKLENDNSLETLKKVIAYLADHKDITLERAAQSKFSQLSLDQIKDLIYFSIETEYPRMLDVCQKMASLKQLKELSQIEDVVELAKSDAAITPQPQRSFEAISKSFSNQWNQHIGIFSKACQYFIATATWTYGIDLDSPPRNRWAAQSQWMIFRTIGEDTKWIAAGFVQFFSTTWKAAAAAAGILTSLMGLKYFYNRYYFGTPETLDKKIFTNLNAAAKSGRLKETVGRKEELKKVEECLSSPPGDKPCIPILVGPPGVGKSQLVECLALHIVNGETARLAGKKVFSINTSNLSEIGNFSDAGYASRLDLLFEQIEGFEDQIILFFDEAHNAANSSSTINAHSPGPLLEQLKTKLLERNILCILATTTEEYEEYIAPNKAFIDRTERIDLPSLSDAETKDILQQKVGPDQDVEVTLDAIDAVLEIGNQQYSNRANPRKSTKILQKAINHVYAWTPSKRHHEIEKLELEYRKYRTECLQFRNQIPNWSLTDEGKTASEKLRAFQMRLESLQNAKKAEQARFEKIIKMKKMEPAYSKREHEAIHLLANPDQKISAKIIEEAQKTYLFLHVVLLPQLRSQIERQAALLEEEIPLRVDAKLVRCLYPSKQGS